MTACGASQKEVEHTSNTKTYLPVQPDSMRPRKIVYPKQGTKPQEGMALGYKQLGACYSRSVKTSGWYRKVRQDFSSPISGERGLVVGAQGKGCQGGDATR